MFYCSSLDACPFLHLDYLVFLSFDSRVSPLNLKLQGIDQFYSQPRQQSSAYSMKEAVEWHMNIVLCWACGWLGAYITVGSMKLKLKQYFQCVSFNLQIDNSK
jgi:hypothetical protein